MDEVTLNAYVIYAFLGAVVLLLITLIGAVLRFTYVVGKIQGQITGLEGQITGLQGQITGLQGQINGLQGQIDALREEMNRLWGAISELRQELTARFERVESEQGALREAVAENRGLLMGLHRRIDQLERHRHEEPTGNVILTPAAPEPVAD